MKDLIVYQRTQLLPGKPVEIRLLSTALVTLKLLKNLVMEVKETVSIIILKEGEFKRIQDLNPHLDFIKA